MIQELKRIFGPKCTAVKVNGEVNEFINLPTKKMKFCEAVFHSFDIPVRINTDNLVCPGARRCMGFDKDENTLAGTIAENNDIPVKYIYKALAQIPVLKNITHINLGITELMEKDTPPDLYIMYLKPEHITGIIHSQAKFEVMPMLPPYSLLSVCGNVFSRCYSGNTISISFGCPESRIHGGIEPGEVVIGIPFKFARQLISLYN
ncbi:MAG: DUF169 domain-containing protein [Bacteroidales bacterium]|nr:DUF169 domain-containing protein [Bacteroidales bacterium]